jgi:hypothetical protein
MCLHAALTTLNMQAHNSMSAYMSNEKLTGRAKGGAARAEKLTPEQRSEIARKGALARKAKLQQPDENVPAAQYAGTLKFGDLSFPCAVLSDGTRVLTETDFMAGLGMYRSGALSVRRDQGAPIPLYLAFKNLYPFVIRNLGDVHIKPLKYRTLTGGIAHGIQASIIPRICSVWLDARQAGVLGARQEQIAEKAELMLRALAEVGIIALIDEATGYQSVRPRDALQEYLEMIIRKELAAWAKKFPDEFYENIYKLKGWPWPGMSKNRFSVVAHYTNDLVYERIAPGLLHELRNKSPKNEKGHRQNRLHQWFTDEIGNPLLAQHIHSLLMFQRLAIQSGYGWARFVKMIDQVMPKKGATWELPLPNPNEP